ncbi:helix-turn-helix domain-containing protein [Cyclobacterium sp. 1_MG-2023]|uniref:helix-turn-helix domain-containing protein n=1 Tax=Cyclobacterium sp. 1_MG-2023 TaxID=3062681 RepID=UPI0026E1390B|nr:helix-turn-helix domain-containing protein [Cyclobacterium sp. 1_MG-2023]MDO6436285.1 helix-turn-helix domain-containing protein [Cyclobacterium sp. 1_MG-2023]
MQTIQITQLSPEQFEEAIRKAVRSQLETLKKEINPQQPKEEYLSRKEVSELLKIELSTLHNWCKKGKLHPYGIGNRVYFLRSDIEKALKPLNRQEL